VGDQETPDAAKECSPRRKPWDGKGSKEKALQGRKKPLL